MLEIFIHIILWTILLGSVIVIPFGVMGTFIIVAATLGYALITHFETISWSFLLILLGLAVFMEIVEAFLGAVLAKKFGGSKYGMFGAMTGGFIGAVIGTPITPVIGTLAGGFLGAFAGASLFEWFHIHNWSQAFRVGTGAFLGALGGKLSKIFVAILMLIMICVRIY